MRVNEVDRREGTEGVLRKSNWDILSVALECMRSHRGECRAVGEDRVLRYHRSPGSLHSRWDIHAGAGVRPKLLSVRLPEMLMAELERRPLRIIRGPKPIVVRGFVRRAQLPSFDAPSKCWFVS